MLKGFYKSLLPVYFGEVKRQFCCNDCAWFDDGKKQVCRNCRVNFMACTCFSDDKKVLSSFFLAIKGKNKSDYCLDLHVSVSAIDSGISSAVRDSMTKVLLDGRMETTITAEKDTGFKRNSTDLWPKDGFFRSQACDFSLEKANLPEMTIFYVNQAYLSYKGNKKIYYPDVYIIGQVVPLLNAPEDLQNYQLKTDEVKLIKPKYDPVSTQFLGLIQTLGYLTVCGDEQEYLFDYDFNKENSKILCSTHKMKITNSFTITIFNRHRIQCERGAFSETDFSNVFFFLPSTTDRIEDINRYIGSVNVSPIDTDVSDFGPNSDPSRLDYARPQKEGTRESVLKVLKKVVNLSNQNLQHNTDGLLAKKNS